MALDARQLELEPFEGDPVRGTKTAFSGSVDKQRTGAYHHDEEVIWIVRATVQEVAHPSNANGLIRYHKFALQEAYPIDHEVGSDLLQEMAESHRVAMDKVKGTDALFGPDGEPIDEETVPDGSADEVLAWVASVEDYAHRLSRARDALTVEGERSRSRKGLTSRLTDMVDALADAVEAGDDGTTEVSVDVPEPDGA